LPTFCNEGIATEFAAYEHYLDNLAFLAKESRPEHVVGVWRASKKNWLPTPNGCKTGWYCTAGSEYTAGCTACGPLARRLLTIRKERLVLSTIKM